MSKSATTAIPTGASTSGAQPLWREHLTLTVSGTLTLVVALKILAVGNYEPETALAIVQVAGTTNVLVAALIAVIPLVTSTLLIHAWGRWKQWFGTRTGTEKMAIASALATPSVILVGVVPIVLIVAVAAIYLSLRLLVYMVRRRESKKPSAKKAHEPMSHVEQVSITMSSFAGLLFLAITTSWMPTEAVTIGDDPPVTAYVVGQRNDETIILPTSRGAGLVVAQTDNVNRNYCDDRSWLSVSIAQAFRQPGYDDCPNS